MAASKDRHKRRDQVRKIIRFAENKLHHCDSIGGFKDLIEKNFTRKHVSEEYILTCSAILAVLIGLEFDLAAPKIAAELVASRLRWAAGCDHNRTYLLTTYPSEPVLAEAAFQLFFTNIDCTPGTVAYRAIIDVVAKEAGKGGYDIGGDGELAARLLCMKSTSALLIPQASSPDIALFNRLMALMPRQTNPTRWKQESHACTVNVPLQLLRS